MAKNKPEGIKNSKGHENCSLHFLEIMMEIGLYWSKTSIFTRKKISTVKLGIEFDAWDWHFKHDGIVLLRGNPDKLADLSLNYIQLRTS